MTNKKSTTIAAVQVIVYAGEKVRVLGHEHHRDTEQREDQAECGVNGVATNDHAHGPDQNHGRGQHEDHQLHQWSPPSRTLCTGSGARSP